jgi:HlyD family secretion protein
MFTKFMLPLVAALGLAFAIYNVAKLQREAPASSPLVDPPTAPKIRSIAGSGIVEAKRENIPIGTKVPGVVDKVYVVIGQKVKANDPLFHIDDRELRAELVSREAAVAAAQAQLHRLKNAPRAEDIPPAVAAVEEAKAKLQDARASFRRTKQLFDRTMATPGEFDRDMYMEKAAEAALARADADLKKIWACSWIEDIKVSEAALLQAQSQVESMKILLDRLTVRAYVDGDVLQVHVRPGQFAALQWNEPLIILGDLDTLHVRVDVDENDLPMFERETKAIATLKGRPGVRFDLDFVKVEPYVIPKKSLTGDNSERVDTRVLQVVYALKSRPASVFVGQQMDVYLKANVPKDLSLEANPDMKRPFEDDPSPRPVEKTAARPAA